MRKLWHSATFGPAAWAIICKMGHDIGMTAVDHQSAMCEWDKHATRVVISQEMPEGGGARERQENPKGARRSK